MRLQHWLYTIPLRIRSLFHRSAADSDLDEELQYHLDQRTREFISKGLNEKEARYAALREFRGVEQSKENCRDARKVNLIQDLAQDLRFGARMLRKNPGFSTIAILTLALGIGANAMVFTIANAFLYKNLPLPDSSRIVYMSGFDRTTGQDQVGISYPEYLDFRAQAKSFQFLAAFAHSRASLTDSSGFPEEYWTTFITANAFSQIGQSPLLGREFLSGDVRVGGAPVAILGYGIWETRYGKDPGIVGKTIHVNGTSTVVIGVMPRRFDFPEPSDLWLPLVPAPGTEKREVRDFSTFGRLAPNVNLRAASAETNAIASRLEISYPASNRNMGVLIQTYNDFFYVTGRLRPLFFALLGAVGFVLLIACANVANLLLSRAVGRSGEISIRIALGASRWRVIRQLLVESLMLSIAGGFAGCLLALWGVRIFDQTRNPVLNMPPSLIYSMDYHVLAYLIAITLGATVFFGLMPALRVSKLDTNSILKDSGQSADRSSRSRVLSAGLVVSEISLAVVLLTGAGLMIRSFLNLYGSTLGVNPNNVLTARINLQGPRYKTPESQFEFYEQLQSRLKALPGLRFAAVTSTLPGDGAIPYQYELEESSTTDQGKRRRTDALIVSPDYFSALEIQPVEGRIFTHLDGPGSPVVIVNQDFASKHWPRQDALGKRLRLAKVAFGTADSAGVVLQPWLTVVGVVPDVIQDPIGLTASPLIYLPLRQEPQDRIYVVARTEFTPATLVNPMRHEVQSIDENLPIAQIDTLDYVLALRRWPWRVFGGMFAVFSFIALVLASIGLYGVMAHSVSQRTKELGVRVALGASSGSILRLVMAQGLRQLAIGIVIGLMLSFAVARAAQAILVGVSSSDPATFLMVALVLVAAGILGCAIPARRAVRVDPVTALRHE